MVYSNRIKKSELFYQEMGKQLNGKEITDNFSRKKSYGIASVLRRRESDYPSEEETPTCSTVPVKPVL